MAQNPYTIGRNCSLVLLWSGSRVALKDVTGFESNQEVSTQRSDPLNNYPIEFNTPKGWRGRFMVDRGDSTLDNLIAAIESGFWNAGIIGSGAIYQYIAEADGSTSTFEYVGASLTLSQAGNYQAENIVKQTINFFASLRNRL